MRLLNAYRATCVYVRSMYAVYFGAACVYDVTPPEENES